MKRKTELDDKNEKAALPYLRDKYGAGLLQIEDAFATFDFEGADILIELKVRTCSVNKYNDIMMGQNKILHAAQNPQIRVCISFFRWIFLLGI
jgi:hypothetical protein